MSEPLNIQAYPEQAVYPAGGREIWEGLIRSRSN
jgi:hypothetical protein